MKPSTTRHSTGFSTRWAHDVSIRTEHLWMISHIGAESDEVGSILRSHPQIHSFRSRPRDYERPAQLRLLEARRLLASQRLGRGFIFDEFLDNDRTLSDRILGRADVRAFVVLAPPRLALPRLIHRHDLSDPEQACDYFCSRLRQIVADAARIRRRVGLLDSEAITEKRAEMLAGFFNWLWLRTPIEPEKAASGVDEPLHLGGDEVQVPEKWMRKANGVYDECREILLARCVSLTSALVRTAPVRPPAPAPIDAVYSMR